MAELLRLPYDKYISTVKSADFQEAALEIFRYQYNTNLIYGQFVKRLNVDVDKVHRVEDIPFLPVSFFKTHRVTTGSFEPELTFESSTTTSDIPARHYIKDELLYRESLITGFKKFYGNPEKYVFLALLPSYLQRGNASLVHMTDVLMKISNHRANGFYLDELDKLQQTLVELDEAGQPTVLLGVTYALLDFAELYPMKLNNTIVMETGGMKGRRKEMIREEVHYILKKALGVSTVHSEYGMTELLSQAYATSSGMFRTADTMGVYVRDINDPLSAKAHGSGLLNIVDLANLHSCAFIATDDIGRIQDDGTFEVLGRADNSALRGCNLMVL